MANEQNLKALSPSEAREFGRMGGLASGKSRRERKRLREIALIIANAPFQDPEETKKEKLEEMARKERYRALNVLHQYKPNKTYLHGIVKPSVMERIVYQIACNAMDGNIQAIKLFLEWLGESPPNEKLNKVESMTR